MRMRWMDLCLVAVAASAGALLLLDSGMTVVLAVVLFLTCPVAMLFVAVGMGRHGSAHR